MSRGVEKRAIYLDDQDRRTFLTYLLEALRLFDLGLFAYCLMSNHFHLLVTVNESKLETAMKWLLSRYSLHFNHRHKRVGHLVQGRYTSLLCESETYLIHLIAYIHLNPVRAGLIEKPSEWPWASHAEFLEGGGPFIDMKRMEKATGIPPDEARRVYRERITAASLGPQHDSTLEELIALAAQKVGADLHGLLSGKKGAAYTRAKLVLLDWVTYHGFSDKELAEGLNCSQAAISLLRKRRAQNDFAGRPT